MNRATAFRSVLRGLPLLALAAAATLVVVLANQNRRLTIDAGRLRVRDHYLHKGLVVPPFEAQTLTGSTVMVGSDDPGHKQILFLFTTTCSYCRENLATWNALAEEMTFRGDGTVQVTGISLDSQAATARYMNENMVRFSVVHFPTEKIARYYRADAVPVTVVLNDDGVVLLGRPGVLPPEAVDSLRAVLFPDSVLLSGRSIPSR